MGRTIAEKILSNHAGRELKVNDVAICDVDFCFGQDGTSSLIIESFQRLGQAEVFNKAKFAMFIDHSSPSPNMGVSSIHKIMRDFAHEKNVRVFEIGEGVCHQCAIGPKRILEPPLTVARCGKRRVSRKRPETEADRSPRKHQALPRGWVAVCARADDGALRGLAASQGDGGDCRQRDGGSHGDADRVLLFLGRYLPCGQFPQSPKGFPVYAPPPPNAGSGSPGPGM